MVKFLLLTCLSQVLWADPYVALDAHIRQQLKQGKIVGTAVAVIEGDKVTFMKAYGVKRLGKKDPVDVNSVFQLGSLSKSVTATLVAVLQKKGLMNAKSGEARQFLSHTTGYKRQGWNSKIEAGFSRGLLLKQLSETEREEVGKFDYHNLAFSQIEDVIERATRQPFGQTFSQYLFKPLGMAHTTVGFDDFSKEANRVWPHVKVKRGMAACKTYSEHYHRTVPSAAGVNANITDMSKFMRLQMGAFPKVIASKELAPFHEPIVSAPDALRWFRKIPHRRDQAVKSYYGCGWRLVDIDGERVVFHSGWLKGFVNFMAFSPDRRVGIVVLANSESSGFSFQTAIRFLLGKSYVG